MCARFNIDREVIEEAISQADTNNPAVQELTGGDIRPTNSSVVLAGHQARIHAGIMRWGLPRYDGKGLIINTRSETALEKQMFRESTLHRRCLIPARVFYEWDRSKRMVTFSQPDQSLIWMAGIYDESHRFSILTTEANESVSKFHDRMPVLLSPEDLNRWLFDHTATEKLLAEKMPALLHRQDYEQIALF